MDALTAKQITILNNLTDVHDQSVDLGTILQKLISAVPGTGTPVNAVEAKMDLTLTGVVLHGQTVTINNPLKAGVDVYEFLTDTAQKKSVETNIGIDVRAHSSQSGQMLTIPTRPTSGDTMTIGEKTYIFVPNGTANADGEISIGTDLDTAHAAIVAAINGTDDHNVEHPIVFALTAFQGNTLGLGVKIGGTAGDSVVSTETFTANDNVFGGAHFGSIAEYAGVDCPAADACADLIAAITEHDTQGVGAEAGTGTVVVLTADIAGADGNNIVLGETLTNGAFTGGATKMAGGVDGTIGSVDKPLIDASYLHICVVNNTKSGKNWRRISLGSAY